MFKIDHNTKFTKNSFLSFCIVVLFYVFFITVVVGVYHPRPVLSDIISSVWVRNWFGSELMSDYLRLFFCFLTSFFSYTTAGNELSV